MPGARLFYIMGVGEVTHFKVISQFSHLVLSDSLWQHGLQHARLSCVSPTPGAYSNSCPSSQWNHPKISSSVVPFSSSLQSFPESGSFIVSQFFASGSQSIGALASASVQFSHSVVSDSLRPHESQHTRPPCPSPTSRVHSDSRPLSPWCHPAISSSVIPFSSCPQSLPASESFPMSQLFAWGCQSTGASALESFLPKKSQGWSPSEWTGWVSKGLSRVFSNTTVQASILHYSIFFVLQLSHPYMTTEKTKALTR